MPGTRTISGVSVPQAVLLAVLAAVVGLAVGGLLIPFVNARQAARTQEDTGQVVILDPRVRTKPYGRTFLASLPECEVVIDDAPAGLSR